MAEKTYNSKIDTRLIMLAVLLLSSLLFRSLMSPLQWERFIAELQERVDPARCARSLVA
jgi:hypothetical protein